MSILESVKIEGLWGDTDLIFQIDERYNFLIGRNGSGKTTAINLISSVLLGDIEGIYKIDFKRIELKLFSVETRRKPSIVVYKQDEGAFNSAKVIFEIKHLASGDAQIYGKDTLVEKLVRQRRFPHRKNMFDDLYGDLHEELKKIASISWISVHRHSSDDGLIREERKLSPVDQKLLLMQSNLGRYLSTLSSKYVAETLEFQKNSFLSFLTSENEGELIDFSRKIDTNAERKNLSQVLNF